MLAEVIGFHHGHALVLPLEDPVGIHPNARVVSLGRPLRVPVGRELCGRVLDGLCRPLDGKGRVRATSDVLLLRDAPSPMERPHIDTPFVTGQRVLDGLITLGQGQRIGLFAGGGVGKSTLLGEIAKQAESDLNVIALIGERGREVRPFIEECLTNTGLAKSVVIVATAEQPALTRIRAAQSAVTIADYFRRRGKNVLFLLDSLTRLAHAQREVGLLLNEPPSARGFPPSVFQLLATTLEMLGRTESGSITSILTVLVDGDDIDEPVSDAVRAILDGHVVLDRKLAEKGHFPAVGVGQSLSRLFRDVTSESHQLAARKIRDIIATYDESSDLIRIGAYQQGSSPKVDRAISLLPVVEMFLKQATNHTSAFDETLQLMNRIAAAWQF
jgi:flagellum-specific ATP synthase